MLWALKVVHGEVTTTSSDKSHWGRLASSRKARLVAFWMICMLSESMPAVRSQVSCDTGRLIIFHGGKITIASRRCALANIDLRSGYEEARLEAAPILTHASRRRGNSPLKTANISSGAQAAPAVDEG